MVRILAQILVIVFKSFVICRIKKGLVYGIHQDISSEFSCSQWLQLRNWLFKWAANTDGLIQFLWTRLKTIIPNFDQQDATFLDLFISTDALHVSGRSSAHHQKHRTVHTALGIVNQYCCWLLSWMDGTLVSSPRRQQQAAVLVDNTWSCMYSYVLLMMGGGTAWNV